MKTLISKITESCRRHYWLAYTLAFLGTSVIVLFVYPSNGRSIMWNIDGFEQYYPFFIYEGQWLRQIFSTLVSGGGLQIPMWEPNLGYGADVLMSIDAIYDPLNALSALCPERFAEFLFETLIVVRLGLAGAAFSAFAIYMGCDKRSTLLAALLYAFCGTAAGSLQWPGGVWGLILFPLILLGVEKMLRTGKPYVFVLATAAMFTIQCYFAYVACIMLVPYCAARVITTQDNMRPSKFIFWVFKFLGLLAIAILISCIALVPNIMGILSGGRATSDTVSVPLLYGFSYYQSVISGFTSFAGIGSDCFMGFTGLGLLATFALFSERGKNKLLKAAFIAMTVGIMLPAAGSMFNGFNYATNRWVFAYALCVCFIVARMLPGLMQAKPRLCKVLLIATAIYMIIMLILPTCRKEATFAALSATGILLAILCFGNLQPRTRNKAVAACLVGALAINVFYMVSPDEGGWGTMSLPMGSGYYKLHDRSPNQIVKSINDESSWRYDASSAVPGTDRSRNASLVLGLSGIDFYDSLYNDNIDKYHTELGVVGTNINFSYKSLANRSALDVLNSVKYMIVPKGSVAPYNYDETVAAEGVARGVPYSIYQGSVTLPYAYTYKAQVSEEDYAAMSPLQKQQSLMQGVVINGKEGTAETSNIASNVATVEPKFTDQKLNCTVMAHDGLTYENGTINVTSANATLTLTFDSPGNTETFLNFTKLNYTPQSPIEQMGEEQFNALGILQKAQAIKSTLEWSPASEYSITATSSGGTIMKIENALSTIHFYGGKSNWLLDMGYSTEPQNSITLTFPVTGKYTFDDMSVFSMPMDSFDSQVQALQAQDLKGATFGTNEFTCSLTTGENEVVYFSIPYSEGWAATVDGQPADIMRANTAFMAIATNSGHHDIKLTYSTPYLGAAAACTAAGIALFAILALVCRAQGKRRKQ